MHKVVSYKPNKRGERFIESLKKSGKYIDHDEEGISIQSPKTPWPIRINWPDPESPKRAKNLRSRLLERVNAKKKSVDETKDV